MNTKIIQVTLGPFIHFKVRNIHLEIEVTIIPNIKMLESFPLNKNEKSKRIEFF